MESDLNDGPDGHFHHRISVNSMQINRNKFFSDRIKKDEENALDVTVKKDLFIFEEEDDLYFTTKIGNVLNDIQNEEVVLNSSRSADVRMRRGSLGEFRWGGSLNSSNITGGRSKFHNLNFVENFKFYLLCSKCLLVIAGESEINFEMKVFLKVTNMIKQNTNFVRKTDNAHLIQCRECNCVIGVELTSKTADKTSDTKPNNNTIGNNSDRSNLIIVSTFLLKNKILVKNEKSINIGLLSLKKDKLDLIHKTLTHLFNSHKEESNNDNGINNNSIPKINMIPLKQTKESLQNFKPKNPDEFDLLFIIHKAEGRVFLLGRNGFYNKIFDTLYKKLNGNIYFLLLYKNIFIDNDDDTELCNLQFQNESIDNLINKGDQKDLKLFKDENKIICMDDEKFDVDLARRTTFFQDLCYKRYCYFNNDVNLFPQPNVNITNEDQMLIEQLMKKVDSFGEEGKGFKCFVL